MASIARSSLFARVFRARAGTARQSFNRVSRRSYASGHDHGPQQAGIAGDIPWLIGSVAVTAGGTYLLWPEPSQGEHGHGHDDHASEEHGEKEDKEEESGKEDGGEEKEEESESKDDGAKEEDNSSSEEDSDDKKDKDQEAGTKEDPTVNEDRSDGNREVKYKDAKGGVKKRLESKNAIKQADEGNGSSAGVHSGQGEHVYNTDTKHSTDQKNNPGMSKKGEGDPDTAKLKTTVDPNRSQK